MRPVHVRSLSLAAVAVLTFASSVSAQDTPSGLLSNLEVRQLVTRGDPEDHVRLSTHFAALAQRYKTEAQRHSSMLQAYTSNPKITQMAVSMSGHCRRLAELNTQSMATLRELAAYHAKLASGTPATPPKDGARFQGGAGAPEPTERELNVLAAKASTSAEHRGLEEYFSTLARRYTLAADEHAANAVSWRGMTRVPAAAITATHCEKLSGQLRDAAKEANAAAAMHKELAGVGR
jgi:hypothetical protein